MTPFEFVFQYHNFVVTDPKMGLNFETSITGYNNKWSDTGAGEMGSLFSALAMKYFARSHFKIPGTFHIDGDSRVDPTEEFYLGTLHRVFQSRGSPDEFRDAVRLAFLAGRCGTPKT